MVHRQHRWDQANHCQIWFHLQPEPEYRLVPKAGRQNVISLPINIPWRLWIESNRFKQCSSLISNNSHVTHMALYYKHLIMVVATVAMHMTVYLEKVLKGTSKCGYSNTYLKFRIVPQETMDYGLFRNQSLPPMRGQNPEALMAKFSTLQRSTSAPQQQFTGKSV